jgi:ribonuclease P/MRP protein subunit POP1
METHIYKPRTYPFGLIAPIAIIWKPNHPDPDPGTENELQEPADVSENTEKLSKRRKRRDKEKGKEKEMGVESDPDVPRTVWIRSHPVVFEDVFSALQTSASLTLDAFKKCPQNKGKEVEVELADLRGQVNAFEIMGSKSSQVIKGAVTPVSGDKREEFKKVCEMLLAVFAAHISSSGLP